MPRTKIATFAAGCFWGPEARFRRINGVVDAAVGYMGGHVKNPTYQMVCTDETGHAEVVQVTYDPSMISYEQLLDAFWNMHDPTTPDRQGFDFGSQYRSAIFYHDENQHTAAEASKKRLDESGQLERSHRDRNRRGGAVLSRRRISSAISGKDRPGRSLLNFANFCQLSLEQKFDLI